MSGTTENAIQPALFSEMRDSMPDKEGKEPPPKKNRTPAKRSGPGEDTQGITTDIKGSGSDSVGDVKPKDNKDLPAIMSWGELREAKLDKRVEIIQGILRGGCKLGIAGGAKAKKTWLLLALACCVASGARWFNKFETLESKVLYVNLELHSDTIRDRISMICEALELEVNAVKDSLHVLNLRNYEYKDHVNLVPRLIKRMEGQKIGLCVLDPVYKILGSTNENDSGAVTIFMNSLDRICVKTGAALALALHYGKGSQAGKQEGDRARGSSVFFGDLDALVEFVEHDDSDKKAEKDVLVAQVAGLREFKPVGSFSVEWDGEALFVESDKDPDKPKKGSGRKSKYTAKMILEVLKKEGKPMQAMAWFKKTGIGSYHTFEPLKQELWDTGLIDSIRETDDKFATYFPKPTGFN